MALDDLFVEIGEMGRYQWKIFILASLATNVLAAGYFSQIFFALETPHWCQVNEWSNDNCSDYGYDTIQCEELKRNVSIPQTENGFSQCEKYNLTDPEYSIDLQQPANVSVMECNQGWVYDTRENGRTIISHFDLVCGKEGLSQLSQSLYFVGALFGSPFYGGLADQLGRRYAWAICIVHSMLFAIVLPLTRHFGIFVVCKIMMGMANFGAWCIPFVYVTEIVGYHKRMFVGIFIEFFWAGGYIFITGMAWMLKDWIYLQVVVIAIHLGVLPIIWIVPESPRWLLATNKVHEAESVLKKIAKGNGRDMPKNYHEIILEGDEMKTEELPSKRLTPVDIIRSRTLFLWTTILTIIWFAHGLTYLGLIYMSGELGFPFYPSFFISAAIEVPAYVFSLIVLSYVGRKMPIIISMIAAGLLCIVAIFVPVGIWKAIVVFAAKFFISISYIIIFVYTTELYPTSLRGLGLGYCTVLSILGTVLTPLHGILSAVWVPFPLVLYGSITTIGGLLTSLLPETRGTMLPETIEEVETLGRNIQKIPSDYIDEKVPPTNC